MEGQSLIAAQKEQVSSRINKGWLPRMIGAPTYLSTGENLSKRLKFVAFDTSKGVKEALGRINFKIGLECTVVSDNIGQATLREETEKSGDIVRAHAQHFNTHQLNE